MTVRILDEYGQVVEFNNGFGAELFLFNGLLMLDPLV